MQHDRSDTQEKGTQELIETWGTDYAEALIEIAGRLGLAPLELHQRMRDRAASLPITPECLTLAELDAWRTGDLPAARQKHLAECELCTEVTTMMEESQAADRDAFLARALPRISAAKVAIGAAVGVPLGAALGVGMARHMGGAAAQTKTTQK